MLEICRKNQFFGISSRFSHFFFRLFAQRCVLAMLKTWLRPIFKKIFFPAKNAGNCRFCRFSLDFFHIFRCFFFSHKNISDIAFLFVRLFVHMLVRCARSYFHYQVGPISMWLVCFYFFPSKVVTSTS